MKHISLVLSIIFFLSVSCFSQSQIDDGYRLYQEGKYQESISVLKKVLKNDSNNSDVNFLLGKVYLESDDFDDAENYFIKAVSVDEKRIEFHLSLATVYKEKTRRASFLAMPFLAKKWLYELEKSYTLDSLHLEARERLIQYYLNAPSIAGGDNAKGEKLALETIEIDEIQGRLLYALALNKDDKTKLAIDQYNNVLVLMPSNGLAHNSLGYIFLEQNNFTLAESHFIKYIEVEPHNPNAYDSMGDYYIKRGMIDRAITKFEKALVVDERFSESRYKLAQALVKKNMDIDAISNLKTLLKFTPNHIRAKDAKKLLAKIENQ